MLVLNQPKYSVILAWQNLLGNSSTAAWMKGDPCQACTSHLAGLGFLTSKILFKGCVFLDVRYLEVILY